MSDSSYYSFKEIEEDRCDKNTIALCFCCMITMIILIYFL